MTEAPANQPETTKAIELLDRLLGVAARIPGTAAKLPAVIRVIESLEPAGGKEFPVFPASYAGATDNDPPVYDLSGITYGEVEETIRGKRRTTVRRPQVIRAERCTVDSPQSQANRMEIAFLDDQGLQSLVPQASTSIPRQQGKKGEESVLRLPHRVADFRVRLSDKRAQVEDAISEFANGDALKLLRLMPTSIVFGFWDSRGEESQHKHARILLSRIDAFDVVPCRRHALYSGPYSGDEFAAAILDKTTADKADSDKMAEQGYTNAPTEGLGGVLVKDKIERLALISLTDIARLNCRDSSDTVDDAKTSAASEKVGPEAIVASDKLDKPKTNAARRYVFALAALAEAYPRSAGSHRLRSGCELVSKSKPVVDLRGGDESYADAAALKSLYASRDMLIAVASEAKGILGIPTAAGPFEVTRDSLRAQFGVASATSSPQPAPSAPEATEPKRSRRIRK